MAIRKKAIYFGASSLRRINNIFGCIANNNIKYVFIPQVAQRELPDFLLSVTKQSWNLTQFSVTNYLPDKDVILNNLILDYNMLDGWIDPAQKFIYKDEMSLSTVNSNNIFLSNFTYKGQVFNVYLIGDVSRKNEDYDRKIIYRNKSYLLIEGENNIKNSDAIYLATEFKKMLSVILAFPVNTMQLSKRGIIQGESDLASEDIYFLETRSNKKKKN